MSGQMGFTPMDYGFKFTADGWYQFDGVAAQKAALKARNAKARELRKAGYRVHCWTLPDQLITEGGIGSGHPEISLWMNCYYVDWS